MNRRSADPSGERILILAPLRRDAPTVAALLRQAGFHTEICQDLAALCEALPTAGAAVIAEEALLPSGATAMLLACLERGPAWSEPPIVLVTPSRTRSAPLRAQIAPSALRASMMMLERPLRSATLISTMHSALSARRRQYQVRDYLREREQAEKRLRAQEQELRSLNEALEQRVGERTAELEAANQKLLAEMQQRREAERALHQAQKMEAIGRLTGGIAHDFNNLLMVVSGGLDMLERAPDPARRERIVSGMRQAASRGAELTKQLLAFSRRTALRPEAIDLRVQLESMRMLIGGALRDDIAVDIDIADDLWPVLADATQLELAILNMAVNARDAMPKGGVLTISAKNAPLNGGAATELNGRFVRIEIRDTGTGIPAEIIDRVFDPFFTTKAIDRGTGLGLSQVYGFATQSGGHAEIQSRVGEGTSIFLTLPCAEEPAGHRAQHAAAQNGRFSGSGRKVLLVEDNKDVAMVATEMLAGLGFAVNWVSTAPEALAALQEGEAVDLVLSDIVMPGGMNGIELARELRRRRPDLPVILTTGYTDAAHDAAALDEHQLLSKPYSMNALEAALKVACRI
jgi:signal transduction histidine kinase